MINKKFSCLGIIPARGGSKRLPRKNFLEFKGKPLVEWTIKSACDSKIFKKIIFSTDDVEGESISKNYPISFSKRPSNLATDKSSLVDVCLDLLKEERNLGNHYDLLFCLYPTSPLRDEVDILNIYNLFDLKNADAVIGVSNYMFYPYQAFKKNEDDSISYFWPDIASKRSEKMPCFCAGNGSAYAIKAEYLEKFRSFITPANLYPYEMPIWKSIDIDTKEDYEMLNMLQ